MGIWKFGPLLAVAVALSPAEATVTFKTAAAYVQAGDGVGRLDTFNTSADQLNDLVSRQQATAKADHQDERFLAQATSSAGSAVRFDDPGDADFFIRTQAKTDALANQLATHSRATATAEYFFSIDTESILSFTIFPVLSDSGAVSNLMLSLIGINDPGQPYTTYRDGFISDSGTSSYTLEPGEYGFTLSALAEDSTAAGVPIATGATRSASANLSLSILSPATPVSDVPEPATWAMMILGFGAIGAASRRRNYLLRAA
jgi:hypothetical protein